jgi:hypothetical protein
MTKLYSLAVNRQEVCRVEIEAPAWLPVTPRVPKEWLRGVVTKALHRYFSESSLYLDCHDRSTRSTIFN